MDKKIFYSKMVELSTINSIEIKASYLEVMFKELIEANFTNEEFLKSIKQIKQKEELFNKMPSLVMFCKYRPIPVILKPEQIADAEFMKVLEYINKGIKAEYHKITELVLSNCYKNGTNTIDWMLNDIDNPEKVALNWLKKNFIEYWLGFYDKNIMDNKDYTKIENNAKVQNVIDGLTNKLKTKN